ncbi:hypothetical protein ACHAXR_013197 [Thalassiosira sp. AJA248-18]
MASLHSGVKNYRSGPSARVVVEAVQVGLADEGAAEEEEAEAGASIACLQSADAHNTFEKLTDPCRQSNQWGENVALLARAPSKTHFLNLKRGSLAVGSWKMSIVIVFLSAVLSAVVTGFLSPPPTPTHPLVGRGLRLRSTLLGVVTNNDENSEDNPHVVVVGKVILDKYGEPKVQHDDDGDAKVTIGGGGPQAAWGACAGLAARDIMLTWEGEKWEPVRTEKKANLPLPPKQRVTFLAPIGLQNWTPARTANACNTAITLNWMPVNGSFGEDGANGLWRDRPSAQDILDAIHDYDGDIVLHAILEAGDNPTGKGLDALPFFNSTLMNRVSAASIEPIVFPNEATGLVSNDDRDGVISLINRVEASLSASCKGNNDRKLLVLSPDRPCYDALFSNGAFAQRSMDVQETEFAVRNGAKGSFTKNAIIPSATLDTPDGIPVNPTGAGNAYSGAYVACRASGSSAEEAASIANAVGAAVCEHEHLPPWTWEVLDRITEAACEVREKVEVNDKLQR